MNGCQPVPPGEPGTCGGTQLCDPTATCVKKGAQNGKACTSNTDCASNNCLASGAICGAGLPSGSYCVQNADCSSLQCNAGTCG